MMKVALIGGPPASGKSHLIQKFIRKQAKEPKTTLKFGRLVAQVWGELTVFGVYDDENFPGTDRLSFDVLHDAITYLKICEQMSQNNILVEGDRLFNDVFITAIKKHADKTLVAILFLEPEELTRRRNLRGEENQDSRFLESRATKYANYIKGSDEKGIELWENSEPKDFHKNMKRLEAFFEIK